MPKLRLYDLFDGADYVGAFTSKEITDRLGISMNAFYNCSNYGTLIYERYGIMATENGETAPDPLFTEWDRTRRCILKGVRP